MEKVKWKIFSEKLTTYLFYFSVFLFFIAFNFQDSRTSGWYQQFLPNLGGKQITDITFLDSLTGYAVATQTSDSSYILKTTNGGDNWQIIYRQQYYMTRIQFLNFNIGYACGSYLYKSTNGGFNWNIVNTSGIAAENMHVLNQDTIWIIDHESLVGGVFRTTNGGVSWTQQFSGGTENPNKIYMYNARIGFICNTSGGSPNIKKTTNGGDNWFILNTNERFLDIAFIDSLTGYRAWDSVKKTTNGGLSWTGQSIPVPFGSDGSIRKLSVINRDTIWGSYPSIYYPNSQTRGMLYRTTNSGNSWYYQIPDTSFRIGRYRFIQFINKYTGWAYSGAIHTTTGGDTTFLSSVHQISSVVPKEYKLFQNYPNPFNPVSSIKYQVSKTEFGIQKSEVRIAVYDIAGKEIVTLVNKKQTPGEYEVKFEGGNLSSGIYFYSLFVDGVRIDTKKAVLIK